SGVRIVTVSAACVIVNSNGFTCPPIEFCGRHVPDRFGGACAARPVITPAVASTRISIARFIVQLLCACNATPDWEIVSLLVMPRVAVTGHATGALAIAE